MLDVNVTSNRIEITRPNDDESEIIITSHSIKIENSIRLGYDDNIEIVIRKQAVRSQAKPPPVKFTPKQNSDELEIFGIRNPSEDFTNSDYVVSAIKELGKPVQNVSDIKPILAKNGYYSEAKDVNSGVRYYLSQDERIVKTQRGYELVEWGTQNHSSQNDLYSEDSAREIDKNKL